MPGPPPPPGQHLHYQQQPQHPQQQPYYPPAQHVKMERPSGSTGPSPGGAGGAGGQQSLPGIGDIAKGVPPAPPLFPAFSNPPPSSSSNKPTSSGSSHSQSGAYTGGVPQLPPLRAGPPPPGSTQGGVGGGFGAGGYGQGGKGSSLFPPPPGALSSAGGPPNHPPPYPRTSPYQQQPPPLSSNTSPYASQRLPAPTSFGAPPSAPTLPPPGSSASSAAGPSLPPIAPPPLTRDSSYSSDKGDDKEKEKVRRSHVEVLNRPAFPNPGSSSSVPTLPPPHPSGGAGSPPGSQSYLGGQQQQQNGGSQWGGAPALERREPRPYGFSYSNGPQPPMTENPSGGGKARTPPIPSPRNNHASLAGQAGYPPPSSHLPPPHSSNAGFPRHSPQPTSQPTSQPPHQQQQQQHPQQHQRNPSIPPPQSPNSAAQQHPSRSRKRDSESPREPRPRLEQHAEVDQHSQQQQQRRHPPPPGPGAFPPPPSSSQQQQHAMDPNNWAERARYEATNRPPEAIPRPQPSVAEPRWQVREREERERQAEARAAKFAAPATEKVKGSKRKRDAAEKASSAAAPAQPSASAGGGPQTVEGHPHHHHLHHHHPAPPASFEGGAGPDGVDPNSHPQLPTSRPPPPPPSTSSRGSKVSSRTSSHPQQQQHPHPSSHHHHHHPQQQQQSVLPPPPPPPQPPVDPAVLAALPNPTVRSPFLALLPKDVPSLGRYVYGGKGWVLPEQVGERGRALMSSSKAEDGGGGGGRVEIFVPIGLLGGGGGWKLNDGEGVEEAKEENGKGKKNGKEAASGEEASTSGGWQSLLSQLIGKERKVWGTEVYTDDSDLIAVLVHSGFLLPSPYPSSSSPPSMTEKMEKDTAASGLLVTCRVIGRLVRYISTERNGLRSRGWGNGHDGGSLVVEGVKRVFAESTMATVSSMSRRTKKARLLQAAMMKREMIEEGLPESIQMSPFGETGYKYSPWALAGVLRGLGGEDQGESRAAGEEETRRETLRTHDLHLEGSEEGYTISLVSSQPMSSSDPPPLPPSSTSPAEPLLQIILQPLRSASYLAAPPPNTRPSTPSAASPAAADVPPPTTAGSSSFFGTDRPISPADLEWVEGGMIVRDAEDEGRGWFVRVDRFWWVEKEGGGKQEGKKTRHGEGEGMDVDGVFAEKSAGMDQDETTESTPRAPSPSLPSDIPSRSILPSTESTTEPTTVEEVRSLETAMETVDRPSAVDEGETKMDGIVEQESAPPPAVTAPTPAVGGTAAAEGGGPTA